MPTEVEEALLRRRTGFLVDAADVRGRTPLTLLAARGRDAAEADLYFFRFFREWSDPYQKIRFYDDRNPYKNMWF